MSGGSISVDEHGDIRGPHVFGRTIRYRDVPVSAWAAKLMEIGIPEHVVKHLATMGELHAHGRYDRMKDDVCKLTGETPTSMQDFVKRHAAAFTRA